MQRWTDFFKKWGPTLSIIAAAIWAQLQPAVVEIWSHFTHAHPHWGGFVVAAIVAVYHFVASPVSAGKIQS